MKKGKSHALEPHSGLKFNKDLLKHSTASNENSHFLSTMYPSPIMRLAIEKTSFKGESVWTNKPHKHKGKLYQPKSIQDVLSLLNVSF